MLPAMAEHVLKICPTTTASWYDEVGQAPFLEDPARFIGNLPNWSSRYERKAHGLTRSGYTFALGPLKNGGPTGSHRVSHGGQNQRLTQRVRRNWLSAASLFLIS